jgi:hypothetical protein
MNVGQTESTRNKKLSPTFTLAYSTAVCQGARRRARSPYTNQIRHYVAIQILRCDYIDNDRAVYPVHGLWLFLGWMRRGNSEGSARRNGQS